MLCFFENGVILVDALGGTRETDFSTGYRHKKLAAEVLHLRILCICCVTVVVLTNSTVRNIYRAYKGAVRMFSVNLTVGYCSKGKGLKQSGSAFSSVWFLYGSGVEAVLKSVYP